MALIGVALFATLVTKGAGKVVTRVVTRHWGLTVEEWLYQMGERQIAPLQRQNAAEALSFFERKKQFMSQDDARNWLGAMDLSKSVTSKTIAGGQEIVGYMQLKPAALARLKASPERATEILASLNGNDVVIGRFFTTRGTSMSSLGIGTQNRIFCRFKVEGAIEVLESVPAATNDSWTVAATKRVVTSSGKAHDVAVKQMVGGGGTQYILPDVRQLYAAGRLKVVGMGTKASRIAVH